MTDDADLDALEAEANRNPEDTALISAQRSTIRELERKLIKERYRTDRVVEAVIETARAAALAQGPIPLVKPPARDRRRGDPEVALLHATDWQGTKVTETYNVDVMRERVGLLSVKVAQLTEIARSSRPVRDAWLLLGGDMIEGWWNFATQPSEVEQEPIDQVVTVAHLIVDLVRQMLASFAHVTVIGEWGNHGRIGSKRDNLPKKNNLDRMTYILARSLLADEIAAGRVVWNDSTADIQTVEIGAYRALLIHGDEVGRNGFASPQTIVRQADRWASGSFRVNGVPWPFRDLHVGHYHTHAEWPMANGLGTVFQTGSTESDNRYAMETMAASAIPSQRLHFIDPVRGRVTAQYKVYLDE